MRLVAVLKLYVTEPSTCVALERWKANIKDLAKFSKCAAEESFIRGERKVGHKQCAATCQIYLDCRAFKVFSRPGKIKICGVLLIKFNDSACALLQHLKTVDRAAIAKELA